MCENRQQSVVDVVTFIAVKERKSDPVNLTFIAVKERKSDPVNVWCFQSEGLNKFDHLEVVFLLEIKRKEDVFPEEVLRIFRAIMHFAKLGK